MGTTQLGLFLRESTTQMSPPPLPIPLRVALFQGPSPFPFSFLPFPFPLSEFMGIRDFLLSLFALPLSCAMINVAGCCLFFSSPPPSFPY